ncbi:hypothetical protein MMC26_005037 [Xylographa opegraphella]|nr:hypothetical protein [Xylographa opegraphella]
MATTIDQEMADPGLKRPAEAGSDSEWEYEYHETETESFFVTLDLPSIPSTKKRKRAEESTAAPSEPNNASTQTPDQEDTAPPEPVAPKADLTAGSPEPENRIQILDLHSREPVISYKNQVYTCQWTSTIGTDMLLAPPDTPIPFPPLYEAPGVSVIATSNIKLVGEPIQLIPRPKHQATPAPSLPSATAASRLAASTRPAVVSPTTSRADSPQPMPKRLPAPAATARRLASSAGMSIARQSQGRFLERLMALKAARGDQDQVILHHRQRPNDSGWKTWTDGGTRAQRRRMRPGAEGEPGWEGGDSDEGWGDEDDDLDGYDEDDGMAEEAIDGPAGVNGTGETAAAIEVANTASEKAPT